MGEEAITSGRQKALRVAMILLDLAITRSRGNLLNAGLRSRSGVLESGQSRAWQLTTPYGAANKVDAVVNVIDRYLAEEAELRGLQSEKQTIHPRDLPPAKHRALIEEVFAILADTRTKYSRPRP